MVQLHQLEGFYRVAVAGGYARAARSFPYPITQPGVYQQVRKLELALGRTLLERVGHDRVALTPVGHRLFEFCEPYFRALPGLLAEIEAGLALGPLRIEAGALEVRYVLPAWLKRLRRAHPELRVDLREIEAPDYARLRAGEVDMIIEHAPDKPADLQSRVVSVHHGFIVLPEHVRPPRGHAALKQLLGQLPLVSFHPAQRELQMQLQALRRHGIEPARVISATGTESILAFVEAGLGYSLVPWPTRTGPARPGVRCLPMRGPGTSFPISALWKRSSQPHPGIAAALGVLPLSPSASRSA